MNKLLSLLLMFLSFICIAQKEATYIYINQHNIKENAISEKINKIKIEKLEIIMEKIIIYYENNGYPFAQIKLENIKNNQADLIVEQGNKYTIDSFAIYGDTKISEKQLYNILDIKKGEVYNQKKIDQINDKIESIGFLTQKKPHEFVFHKNTLDIYFYLEKQKNNFADGLIGFNVEENKIKLNGFINIQLNNVINKSENINVFWSSDQEKFQKLESLITFPYIINSKIGINAKFNIYKDYKENNEFTNIMHETGLIFKTYKSTNLIISYQNKKSITNESLSDSKQNNIGFGIIFNNKSTKLNLSGYFGTRNIRNTLENNFQLNIKTLNTKKIKKIQTSFSTNSSLIFSKGLHENELLFFGGSNSLKGFDENYFRAKKYIVTTSTMSYSIEEKTSLSVFYQQSYFERKTINEQKISDWPRSTGIGFSLNTKSGILYMQYAIGISKDRNFNFQNGKIHLGIESKF